MKGIERYRVKARCRVICCAVIAALFCVGCKDSDQGVEVKKEPVASAGTEAVSDFAAKISDDMALQAGESQDQQVMLNDSEGTETGAAVQQDQDVSVVVYVCGAVNAPGVYMLNGSPRMKDAVEMAGGMSPEADEDILNLAQYISDGQMIRIPYVGEADSYEEWSRGQQTEEGTSKSADGSQTGSGTAESQLVNINEADVQQLMTIPGIGQSKAEAIIRYREEFGRFEEIEDIMQVSGIKESSFAKMKNYICVR